MINLFKKHKEIILYLIFGVATTAVSFIVYSLLVTAGLDMTVSNGIAWLAAVTFAFVTNKLFVFESKKTDKTTLLKEGVSFFGARIFSGIIEIFAPTALFWLGLDQPLFGIEGFVAKAIVSVGIIVLNYVLSKLIVFRKK